MTASTFFLKWNSLCGDVIKSEETRDSKNDYMNTKYAKHDTSLLV